MRKFIIIGLTACVLSSLMLFTGTNAHGSSQSQALVEQGRALLFNNGKITYSGMVTANEKFKQAAAADGTDQQALFFYTVSRISVSFLAEGSSGNLETFRDLLESIGMPRNSNDFPDQGPPFRDIMHINRSPNFPGTTPDGDQVKAFLSGPVVLLMDNALSTLSFINASFKVVLTADEINADHDIEIDYTDILLFRSFLESFKSAVLIITAYNLDVNVSELAAFINFEKYSDIFSIQRDILDKYPDVFKLIPTAGEQSLANAKAALLAGIKDFDQALNEVQAETDDQSDDLFFFQEPKELLEAKDIEANLIEVRDSLNENRPANFTEYHEEWVFRNNSAYEIGLYVQKGKNNQFVSGEFWGLDTCQFVTCSGKITSWTTNGSTLAVELESDCPGTSGGISAILTATLSEAGQQATGGTFTVTNQCGPAQSGTFTGSRQNAETETQTMDFNRIFGNTGKAPLDIRGILPEFDRYNEPVAGTFPPVDNASPVLNGFFPELQTNTDVAQAFEVIPSGYLNIPRAAIFIDGSFNDWAGVSPVFADAQDDDDPDFTGMDMEKFYMAEDDNFYYFRMTFYEDLGNGSDGAPAYGFIAKSEYEKDSWTPGDRSCVVWPLSNTVRVVERGAVQPNITAVSSYAGNDYARAGAKSVEWKVPKQDMGNLPGKFVGTFAKIQQSTLLSDIGTTRIMLGTASVSGTVTCPSCTSNHFYVLARGNFFGVPGAMTSPDRTFTVEGLPIHTDMDLISLWDADGNGIVNNLDRVGGIGPVQIPEDGLRDINIVVEAPASGESTLSGEVVCDGFQSGLGKIYVFVLNGPDPNRDGLIKTAILDGPGAYSVDHLNLHETVWVYAYWDINNSGGAGPDKKDLGALYVRNPVVLNSEEISGINLSLKIYGDIDDSGVVDLADAILGLKASLGLTADHVNLNADVNNDGKIGLPEVIFILQTVSGV
jgi:hypothetical protein